MISTPSKTKRINLTPVDYSKAIYKKCMPLSVDEETFKESLRKTENAGIWGEAIRTMFVDYTDTHFRELVCELLSQETDDSYTMFKILGYEAYQNLLKLKP